MATAGISRTLEHTGNTSSDIEAGVCKLNSIHRSCRKSDRKREGQLLFWLQLFRIMHVMRNLGEWKKPISRIFDVPVSAGSFVGLVQPFCTFCTFYHILLIFLSHAYRLSLRYALLHRFDCDSFCSCKHLCACFITFHAAFYNLQFAAMVVHLLLRRHYFARF